MCRLKVELNSALARGIFGDPSNAEPMRVRFTRTKTRDLPVMEVDFIPDLELGDGPVKLSRRDETNGWRVAHVRNGGSTLTIHSMEEDEAGFNGIFAQTRYDLVPMDKGERMRFLMIEQRDVEEGSKMKMRFNSPVASVVYA